MKRRNCWAHLLHTINIWAGKAWKSIQHQESIIISGEEDRAGRDVWSPNSGLPLSSLGRGQLLHLHDCLLVPPFQSLPCLLQASPAWFIFLVKAALVEACPTNPVRIQPHKFSNLYPNAHSCLHLRPTPCSEMSLMLQKMPTNRQVDSLIS